MGKEAMRNELKNGVLETIGAFLSKTYDADVLRTGTSKIMMPGLDKDGNEIYFEISVTIPRGTRNGDGNGYAAYNGYDAAKAYELECEANKAEKVAKANRKAQAAAIKQQKAAIRKADQSADEDLDV